MLPTASKHQRALTCPASEALPHEPQPETEAAREGTRKHELLARALRDATKPEERTPWLDDVEALARSEGLHIYPQEVALGYRVAFDQARFIGFDIGRNYGNIAPDEVVGSADYVSPHEGLVSVVDLKTGRGEVEPPANNYQLLTLALAASRLWSTTKGAQLGILKAPEGQEPRLVWATVPQEALEQHAQRLATWFAAYREALADVAAGKPPRHVVTSSHCRYCPARGACPAQSATLTQVAAPETRPTFRESWRAALARGDAATVWAIRQTLRGEVEALDDALREAAKAGPLDIGEGRTYGWRTVERASIDAEKAWDTLANTYGLEVARAAMTLETSKAGVERAMRLAVERAKAEGRKLTLKAAVSLAMDELKAAGAVETKTTERCEEMTK